MGTSGGRRTQDQRRAETERRVVDAAIDLIAGAGSRRLTLARVGEVAGYSRGIVYHHFGGREQLVRAVLERVRTMDLPGYDGDGLRQVTRVVHTYLTTAAGHSPSSRAFHQLWMEALAADPVVQPMFGEHDDDFQQFLSAAIERGRSDGSIRPDLDVAAAGAVVMALLRGTSVQLAALPPGVGRDAVITEAVRFAGAAFEPVAPGRH
ncbi:TetR/AcrR family transcriptional regulator [Pseudonocardia sp. ICBG1293]|uniref:TetR/AcrR family transcriptional regulator n=1 Tax=Pseudonocardia sp. ICBG1293 TaxID=2844382 RepID=UPI001CCFECC3|nr:TetR/AcrR family transcriptional regulator [Pseudonocardia sp. ICBG1293]